MPGMSSKRSPVRKMRELSGSVTLEDPATQSPVPVAPWEIVLITQVLVGGLFGFGIGSGGPKRQPAALQVRWVAPDSPAARLLSVSFVPAHDIRRSPGTPTHACLPA